MMIKNKLMSLNIIYKFMAEYGKKHVEKYYIIIMVYVILLIIIIVININEHSNADAVRIVAAY